MYLFLIIHPCWAVSVLSKLVHDRVIKKNRINEINENLRMNLFSGDNMEISNCFNFWKPCLNIKIVSVIIYRVFYKKRFVTT